MMDDYQAENENDLVLAYKFALAFWGGVILALAAIVIIVMK